jgi:hypothetical protein
MLLSIKISLKMHDKKSAETTWKEFQKRFPDLLNSKEVQKIAEQLK